MRCAVGFGMFCSALISLTPSGRRAEAKVLMIASALMVGKACSAAPAAACFRARAWLELWYGGGVEGCIHAFYQKAKRNVLQYGFFMSQSFSRRNVRRHARRGHVRRSGRCVAS